MTTAKAGDIATGAISMANIAAQFGGATPHSLNEYYKGGSLVLSEKTQTETQSVDVTVTGGASMGSSSGALSSVATNISIPANTVFSISIPVTMGGTFQATGWSLSGADNDIPIMNSYKSAVSLSMGSSLSSTNIVQGPQRLGFVWQRTGGTVTNESVSASGIALSNQTLSNIGPPNSVGNAIRNIPSTTLAVPGGVPDNSTAIFSYTTITGSISFSGTTGNGAVTYLLAAAAYINDARMLRGAPSSSSGWTESNTQTYDTTVTLNASVPEAGTDVGDIIGRTNPITFANFYGATN